MNIYKTFSSKTKHFKNNNTSMTDYRVKYVSCACSSIYLPILGM